MSNENEAVNQEDLSTGKKKTKQTRFMISIDLKTKENFKYVNRLLSEAREIGIANNYRELFFRMWKDLQDLGFYKIGKDE